MKILRQIKIYFRQVKSRLFQCGEKINASPHTKNLQSHSGGSKIRRVNYLLALKNFLFFGVRASWRKISRKRKNIIIIIAISLIPIAIIAWHAPTWYKEYIFRTRWPVNQESLKPAPDNNISQNTEDTKKTCEERRKEAGNLYSALDIPAAIKNSQENKIILVGKEENGENSDAIVVDASGKDITLFCFDFNERLVIQNASNLEIGFSNFQNISGNALTIANGRGKIHDNLIENSQMSGIFIDEGKWEIFGNTIQKNSSYGIYGGYGADLNIHENAISGNKGYQVRLMKTREVYK